MCASFLASIPSTCGADCAKRKASTRNRKSRCTVMECAGGRHNHRIVSGMKAEQHVREFIRECVSAVRPVEEQRHAGATHAGAGDTAEHDPFDGGARVGCHCQHRFRRAAEIAADRVGGIAV